MEDSDVVQLVEYDRKKSGRKRRRQTEAEDRLYVDSHSMATFSDSEGPPSDNVLFKETNVFSDSEAESLPSLRAQMAASNRAVEFKESTPLLDSKPRNESSILMEEKQEQDSDVLTILKKAYKISRVALLTPIVVVFVILFAINEEHEEEIRFISLNGASPTRDINFSPEYVKHWKFLTLDIEGPFLDLPYDPTKDVCADFVFVCGLSADEDYNGLANCSQLESNENCHSFQLRENFQYPNKAYELFTEFDVILELHNHSEQEFILKFSTENNNTIEFQVLLIGEKISQTWQVVISAIILVAVYLLIGFDVVHRAVAAMIGSTCTLAVLSMLDKRPTLEHVVQWIDLETVCLLFGMMTLVAIFSQTGFFDYSAVKAYKLARGKTWPLITILCLFSAVVSAFLDNVTTILLLVPVSIRLCQVLNLDPRPVLIAEVVFSNIGGTGTAIGDPPNVIIVSNPLIKNAGIDFSEFTMHLVLGIILCLMAGYGVLSLSFCAQFLSLKNKDPPHISELKREVAIWERTAQRLNVVSLEERAVRDALRAKAAEVKKQLKEERNVGVQSAQDMWQKNLAELESKYRITDRVLLAKSTAVLVVVILMFFLSNLIPSFELELGWIAIFGGMVLIILADVQEIETVLHKIEWGTLLFFAALFVLMEGLGELGLIRFIGDRMVDVIRNVHVEHQMTVSIVLVLWVSALASSFIDNIPFTTATIPVIVELANSKVLCLSLKPLVWSLAFGACLGGNGTLIGASANVVCAGIAEQNGYKISFMRFCKLGFPMMLVTTFVAMIYLLICHAGLHWNTGEAKECVAAYNSSQLLSLY